MLLSKSVKMKWNRATSGTFIKKGYKWTKFGDEFEVKIEDLSNGSNVRVDVKCDCEDCKQPYLNMTYKNYIEKSNEYGTFYCKKCKQRLFNGELIRQTKLENSISFEKWCVDNLSKEECDDILSRWDYELNVNKNGEVINPNEVSYGNTKKYWFKCNCGKHKSKQKYICNLTGGKSNINCRQCNSFGEYLINEYGDNALDLYWDYDKNKISPFEIGKTSGKKVWIKCQEKDYHESYESRCSGFKKNARCPLCTNHHGKVHPLDSLGQYIIDNYGEEYLNKVWSGKNEKSAFEYSPMSNKFVWWKCNEEKHEDYYRGINSSNAKKFNCPVCSTSKGELKVIKYLKDNDIYYEWQKEYDGLIGLKNGNLSYDFYLPKYNLLIEYQGEQHEKPVDFTSEGKEIAKERFKNQQEHDRRKKQYAIDNNINLLEIWYWDFDNIEEILHKELKI